MENQADVVVVGAGPVGLLAAIELSLGGVHVVVLERLAAPSMVLKAGGIGPLGIEALQRRGMATDIAAAQARSMAMMAQFGGLNGASPRGGGPKISGHFAGLVLIRADAQKEPERRSSPVDQQAIEAMLADRAGSLGIDIHRECDVTGLVQHVDGVDVAWTSATGEGHIRCSYLVGCDGGRSRVRKMAGFDFPGSEPTLTMYQALAEVDYLERFPRGFRYTSGGMFGALLGRIFMLDFSGPPKDRDAPVTREEFEAVLRRVSGVDVRVKAFENASRWTDNTRLADTYCRDRVLLAGDAAHVHSPFGGQGMSLGLADAANLGWKLAAVIRGEMPESLLDTYTAERRPVAEAVLANTLAQAAIMRPDPQSAAMRDVVAKLLEFDDVNRFMGEMISGLSIRYDLGSERDDVGRLIGDRPISHGDIETSLYAVMEDGMGVFLDASTGQKASELVAATTQRIRCVTVDTGPSMLIRPDACVAWAGEENSADGLQEAVRRWFR
ncbi:FAD-dependent monooxygenase [Bradyrhizobium sp. dw_411]|uniref:FAD-dependent monooxygenase n=1 Tax=Bradyrhizobium sp. dw_411 TaxID=2720082 RepID=UPI001BD0955D|nr:FAD-dependent monooxygenase [Bradyrhizobium sp. dw_411]